MALDTFDRTPPPFFRQGPSALTKLLFFSALALFLMVADSRLQFAQPLRAGVATVLLPVQRTLSVPVQMWQGGAEYLRGLDGALANEKDAQLQLALLSEKAAAAQRLAQENLREGAKALVVASTAPRPVAASGVAAASAPLSR